MFFVTPSLIGDCLRRVGAKRPVTMLVPLFALAALGCGKEALHKGKSAQEGREALLDQRAGVRRAAVTAMAALNVKEAIPDLIALLQDHDPHIRRCAAEALWGLGGSEAASAIPGLISLLEDEDADVRLNAVGALGQIAV